MFTGMTIEELINSVERAELRARQEQKVVEGPLESWVCEVSWQEHAEVA
jgi:hypothetical protein